VPPAMFGGRVEVAVAAAVAAPPSVAVGATVSVAAPPAAASVGEAMVAGVVSPAAPLVGGTEVEPGAQADRTARESAMMRRTETAFDNLNLELFIILSFVHQANVTIRLN
jgi:hypothetical protein